MADRTYVVYSVDEIRLRHSYWVDAITESFEVLRDEFVDLGLRRYQEYGKIMEEFVQQKNWRLVHGGNFCMLVHARVMMRRGPLLQCRLIICGYELRVTITQQTLNFVDLPDKQCDDLIEALDGFVQKYDRLNVLSLRQY